MTGSRTAQILVLRPATRGRPPRVPTGDLRPVTTPGAARAIRRTHGPGVTRAVRRTAGRHRAGEQGLRHCADLPAVRTRLASRHVTRQGSRRRRRDPLRLTAQFLAAVASVAATTTVMVSGWYAAAGASAVAQMVTP